MTAEILHINPERPEQAFYAARKVITRGGIIVYPTDTFYALGVDPNNAAAVAKVFKIKGRKASEPILLLIKNADQVGEWTSAIPPLAERLMKQFWPGPLTLVFQAGNHVLPQLTGGSGAIGLRVPGNELTRRLLDFVGTALTGTSANLSGMSSPRSAAEAENAVGGRVDLILDGGTSAASQPSTVVDAITGKVVRRGSVIIEDGAG